MIFYLEMDSVVMPYKIWFYEERGLTFYTLKGLLGLHVDIFLVVYKVDPLESVVAAEVAVHPLVGVDLPVGVQAGPGPGVLAGLAVEQLAGLVHLSPVSLEGPLGSSYKVALAAGKLATLLGLLSHLRRSSSASSSFSTLRLQCFLLSLCF